MRTDDLKRMISIFYDMELNNYMMKNCINDIDLQLNDLRSGSPKPIYNEPNFKPEDESVSKHVSSFVCIGILLGIIPGWIYGCESVKGNGGGMEILSVPISVCLFCFFSGMAGLIIGSIVGLSKSCKAENRNNEERKRLS